MASLKSATKAISLLCGSEFKLENYYSDKYRYQKYQCKIIN